MVKAGAVRAESGQAQHVEGHRKILLRKQLLDFALTGTVYVPFVGDGDIASELYADRRIYAADIDPARAETARGRLPDADVRVADCDNWPFADVSDTFAVADFDSYSYPYASFRAFWERAEKADRLVIFFTDGQRESVKRSGVLHHPDGRKIDLPTLIEKRQIYNRYWLGTILPWFTEYVAPWKVQATRFYLRGTGMLYWGAVIDSPECQLVEINDAESARDGQRVFKKFNQTRQKIYLEALRGGKRKTQAAERAQVDYVTIWQYRKEHPDFLELEDQAEVAACDPVEDALRDAATSGNVPAIQMWLYNRSKDRWKPANNRTEITGKDGEDLKVKHSVDLTGLSDEELDLLERIVGKTAQPG